MEALRKNNVDLQEFYRYTEHVRSYNDAVFEATGKTPKAYARHYGCQQNVSDGEKINGMLLQMGYVLCESPQDADLILYNTCAVRENAEDRIFGNVGALKHAKRRNPRMVVCLCGCMVQQEHISEKIKKSFPYVDLVFGTHAVKGFPQMLYNRLSGEARQFDITELKGEIIEGFPVYRDGTVKAFLPVMYGCDNFCTYCVVPLVRGRERSRAPGDIFAEAETLVQSGYRDITLLGQNVNSYGKNLPEPVNFSALLRKIAEIDGDFRIRFMTSHPKDCTRELIDTIAAHDKICSHIHLPVQSGSDRILAAMNRRYTRADYLALINYAKEKIPGISFTSDIIVGFPGETEQDFEDTLSLMKEVGYHSLFTFLYSKRAGTKAAEMEDDTPAEEKSRRFQKLLNVQQEIGAGKYSELVGKTIRVLAEGIGKTGDDYLIGRSEAGVIVDFLAPKEKIGEFVNVDITGALNWAVLGEIKMN